MEEPGMVIHFVPKLVNRLIKGLNASHVEAFLFIFAPDFLNYFSNEKTQVPDQELFWFFPKGDEWICSLVSIIVLHALCSFFS